MNARFKKDLQNGKKVCGIMLSEFYVPNIARLLATCGYDYLLVDCEHGYFDMTQVANLVAAADGCSLPVIVRVCTLDQAAITKLLDMGVSGILLSDVGGVEEAKRLVELCLYAPMGDRGVSTFRAHTGYSKGNLRDIMDTANDSLAVICQIESVEAVNEVENILAVPGLDGVIIGPNDLSNRMGMIGRYLEPPMSDALEKVAGAARAAGKWSGIITASEPLLERCNELGMTCYCVGSELSALAAAATSSLKKTRAMLEK